jgi:hypothetical protein
MMGVTRGFATLAGAGVAGVLLWFATQVGTESASAYWATYGLIAAAGLTMALSQILGGWTKWGWPRFSFGVFLIGFLPVLLVGGWVLLARQPADWLNTSNWSRDLGVHPVVLDLGNILPAIAFGIGLVFGYVFDTAGPRTDVVEREHVRHDERVVERDADEPLTADRGPYGAAPTTPIGTAAETTGEPLPEYRRYPDDDVRRDDPTLGEEHRHPMVSGSTTRNRRVEH